MGEKCDIIEKGVKKKTKKTQFVYIKKQWGTLVRNRFSGNFCWAETRPKSEQKNLHGKTHHVGSPAPPGYPI